MRVESFIDVISTDSLTSYPAYRLSQLGVEDCLASGEVIFYEYNSGDGSNTIQTQNTLKGVRILRDRVIRDLRETQKIVFIDHRNGEINTNIGNDEFFSRIAHGVEGYDVRVMDKSDIVIKKIVYWALPLPEGVNVRNQSFCILL